MKHTSLPPWRRVLAVVAHPDDESFGLGAALAAFTAGGARLDVVSLTRGESGGPGAAYSELALQRERELGEAAGILGATTACASEWPDGKLSGLSPEVLAADVIRRIDAVRPEGLMVFDPSGVTGHPDHQAATAAAVIAAERTGLPVLAWTIPHAVAEHMNREHSASMSGHSAGDIDITVAVDRATQRRAIAAHASQAANLSAVEARLNLHPSTESLRWLLPADAHHVPRRTA